MQIGQKTRNKKKGLLEKTMHQRCVSCDFLFTMDTLDDVIVTSMASSVHRTIETEEKEVT